MLPMAGRRESNGIPYTLTGNYSVAWAALIAIGAIAFTLQWTADDRPAELVVRPT